MRQLIVTLLLGIPLQALAAPSVWTTHATVKIHPDDAPGSAASASIWAARNEFEAFQVAVNGGSAGATAVSMTAPTLLGPGGAAIPAANVRLYREALITTTYASNLEAQPGAWPDALIPDVDALANQKRNAFPFDVPPGENRVVWVEVLVPQDATPGTYDGTVEVTGGSGFSASVPVSLTVWPFALPSTASLHSTFGIAWDGPCQESYGGYGGANCNDAQLAALRAQWSAWFLDHRLTVDAVYTGPSSQGGGYDWASWDAIYGPLFDGTAPTRLPGARATTIRYTWTRDQAHYAAWAQHFRQKGWFGATYDYTCDEPPATCAWSDIPARAAMIHAADPGFRTLVTTNIDDASTNGALASIDIISPVINQMDDKYGNQVGNQRANYDAYVAGGGELFWYQSCMSEGCGPGQPNAGSKGYDSYFTGWPMYQVDAPAVRNRAQEWLSFLFGIQGELYYETDQAESSGMDPYADQWIFGGNGDGTLVYPGRASQIGGTTPIPVASMRLDLIREGMEDYEYLKLVSDLGDPAFARTEALAVASNTHSIDDDPSVLYAARTALAQRIIALSSSTSGCSDGTAEGACSATAPMQCSGGQLVASCGACGCPGGQTCQTDGTCATVSASTYTALPLSAAPTLDGALSEYEGMPQLALGSSNVQAAWDDQNLYVAFDVAASRLVASDGTEPDVYDASAVEVMIDPDANGGASADANDIHLVVDVAGNVSDALGWTDFTWTSGARAAVDLEGGTVGGAAVGRGYRVELAIPWSAIGLSPRDGLGFGFDVAIDDIDGAGALSSRDWAGLSRFNDPAGWGQVTLGARPAAGSSGSSTSTGGQGSTAGGATTGQGGTSGAADPSGDGATLSTGCSSGGNELAFFALLASLGLRRSRRGARRVR